jgi:hypothetical protein
MIFESYFWPTFAEVIGYFTRLCFQLCSILKDIYKKQFNGMINVEIRLEMEHWIHQSQTSDEKEFLISFLKLKPKFSKLGIIEAETFPSIRWKQMNLNKLKNQNIKKFELQSSELKKRIKKSEPKLANLAYTV